VNEKRDIITWTGSFSCTPGYEYSGIPLEKGAFLREAFRNFPPDTDKKQTLLLFKKVLHYSPSGL